MKVIDITGQRFNRWTVIRRLENTTKGQARWFVKCDCGKTAIRPSNGLIYGRSKSCGCLRNETTLARSTKHHNSSNSYISPTYHSWAGMKARCDNPEQSHYKHYGGRGITYDPRWSDFANFYADMGDKPKGYTLDRIDVNGNYEMSNCKWATRKQQARNKTTTRFIEFNGVTRCLQEWAEILGVSQATLRERLDKWPIEKALTHPKMH